MKKLLALGDCNTEGDTLFKKNSFPERFAKLITLDCINCGYTMSTTKEMINFEEEFNSNDIEIILIQYGLVDSWRTFKYSPYVLYYPDSAWRKRYRKLIKKYKKIARNFNLDKIFGDKFVVSPEEYKENIKIVIEKNKNKKIFLIDTIPNKELFRNKYIQQYNKILDDLVVEHSNCHKIDIYSKFDKNFDHYYIDNTHINDKGYDIVMNELLKVYNKC